MCQLSVKHIYILVLLNNRGARWVWDTLSSCSWAATAAAASPVSRCCSTIQTNQVTGHNLQIEHEHLYWFHPTFQASKDMKIQSQGKAYPQARRSCCAKAHGNTQAPHRTRHSPSAIHAHISAQTQMASPLTVIQHCTNYSQARLRSLASICWPRLSRYSVASTTTVFTKPSTSPFVHTSKSCTTLLLHEICNVMVKCILILQKTSSSAAAQIHWSFWEHTVCRPEALVARVNLTALAETGSGADPWGPTDWKSASWAPPDSWFHIFP